MKQQAKYLFRLHDMGGLGSFSFYLKLRWLQVKPHRFEMDYFYPKC